jgi:fido (protein-threonine AMPylation protein)
MVMKDINVIKQTLDGFRQAQVPFITVTNSEWYSLFRDEIRNSIAIEGIFANRSELLSVLERGQRTSNQKTAAILGYYEAASTLYEYANNLYQTGEFELRLSDLRQIHTLLMRYEHQLGTFTGALGGFRQEDVAVTQSRFTPLNPLYLETTLRVYIRWLNTNIKEPRFDLLTFIAASHVLFETIHPFLDGNGRAGRILLSYLLIGNGLINIAIKGTAKADRDKYYHALEVGEEPVDAMLRQVENGEPASVTGINESIVRSNLEPLKAIILERLNYSLDRVEKDVKTMDWEALIPLRDAARFYNYSQDYLRQLIHQGKLPAEKRGKLWYVRVRDIEHYSGSVQRE